MTQAKRLLDQIEACVAPLGLMAMGAARTETDQTVVLVGTAAAFWEQFSKTPEYLDGLADPVDRWSQRVMPEIMQATGAQEVVYPFGGPPYAPFLSWAKQSGEAFDSPVGMLVHHKAGLMISYRGGLVFDAQLPPPAVQTANPCMRCTDRPCLAACPVGALTNHGPYDVPTCKEHIATPEGSPCLTLGCAVRRSCPVSQSYNRHTAQSAHHMRAFKGDLE